MLGPPVCVKCEKVFKYSPDERPCWRCPECGTAETQHHALTIPKALFDKLFPEASATK